MPSPLRKKSISKYMNNDNDLNLYSSFVTDCTVAVILYTYCNYFISFMLMIIKDFVSSGKLHVITEFCCGGNLRHLLINSRVYPSEESSTNYINLASKLNHRQLLKIAADVANGMIHLSSQKVFQ